MADAVEIVKLDLVWALEKMKTDMVNFCYAPCTTLQALSCFRFASASSFLNLSNANLSSFSTFKRLAFLSTS